VTREALPVAEFIAELQSLVRAHPLDPDLAQSVKYGKAPLEHLRRWAKDYFHYFENDVQATAATLARCLDRKLFLALSESLARKAGFYQVASPLDLYLRFTDALGISRADLARHHPCAETLGGLFTKRNFQHSSFLEGFTATYLASEGAMMEAVADHSPFLAQKGFAEYLRRNYGLPEGSTDYWRAYEDFRSFDGERAWEMLADLGADASSQATVRRTFLHSTLVYQAMRRAWSELATGKYFEPELVWPKAGING
jgi:pyrroloquinoline quinone (PQQ) biosynthesis protein C